MDRHPPLRPLGETLRVVREDLGVSMDAAANVLGVSRTGMSNRELGTARLWPDELVRFEDAFGLLRGTVLRRAGYVVDPAGPVEQINSWSFLEERWRAAIRRMVEPELPAR